MFHVNSYVSCHRLFAYVIVLSDVEFVLDFVFGIDSIIATAEMTIVRGSQTS